MPCVSSTVEGRQRVLHERRPTDQTAALPGSSSDDEVEALVVRSQTKHSDVVTRPLLVGDGAEHLGLLIAVNSGGEPVAAGQHDAIEGLAISVVLTVDQLRLSEQSYANSEAFRPAFENAANGMLLFPLNFRAEAGRIQANPAFCEMFAVTQEQLRTMSPGDLDLRDKGEVGLNAARLQRLAETGGGSLTDVRQLVRTDGSVFPARVKVSVTKRRPTDVRGSFAICSIVDISIERAEQHRLQNLARFDPMTGLLNRAAIVEELQQLCAAAEAGGVPGAVFFCDLDQFKGVNDRHGHAVGDRVLQTIAARLLLAVPGYAVGRLGGDELLVVASGTDRS